jgi:hypothetical protein
MLTACGESLPRAQSPAAGPRQPASGRFVAHVDPAAHAELAGGLGFRLAADVGFEATGCCGLALYAGHTSRASDLAKEERATEVLDGGLEVNLAPRIAIIDDRLRFRVRGGKAGTPPYQASGARAGFAASAGVLVRLSDVQPPDVGHAAPAIDLLAEFNGWSLGREQTSAGPRQGSEGSVVAAIVFGVRVGLEYGIDLK